MAAAILEGEAAITGGMRLTGMAIATTAAVMCITAAAGIAIMAAAGDIAAAEVVRQCHNFEKI